MIRFEIKKIFSRPINKIAFMILAVVLCVVSFLAIGDVEYVDENGETITGAAAAQALKYDKNKWSGYITDEVLLRVLEENAIINNSKENLSKDIKENNKAYAKKQGFYDIREMLNRAFCGLQEYDYYRADSITQDEVYTFYDKRMANLIKWINSVEQTNHFSETEKQFLIAQYEALESPIYYEYANGWEALLQYAPTIIMMLVLITGFLVSGIFSDEFQLKADSIFFSTKLGRNKAVAAKIGAGLIVITSVYWIITLLYSLIVLIALGTGGAECAIQISGSNWASIYNITYLQDYLLTMLGGYLGNLFILIIAMFASAKMRSRVFAVTIPFILLFLPSFLSEIPSLSGVLGLLPDQLLQMSTTVRLFNTYQIGNTVAGAVPIILTTYLALSCLFLPVLYHAYRKIQIK